MRLTLDYPPVWLALLLALAWMLSQWLPGGFGGYGFWPGWALIAVGFGLMGLAAGAMRAARTTIIPHEPPSALVTGGIFSRTRNPIYLGDLLILLGAVLIWDAAAALILVPVLAAVLHHRFILPEEARLRAVFGGAFERYAARVRRWI
jgi:protein-S-isoprenylcysteine O-methyltransferase Ste14